MYRNNDKIKIWILKQKLLSVILWILIWQIIAWAINETVLLATPLSVLKSLFGLLFEKEFLSAVMFSLSRIGIGFSVAFTIGSVMAALSYRFSYIELILYPFMSAIKAVPVVSFIILCLIFINADKLPVLISFLMVLPVIYTGILSGIRSTDVKLLEMAQVFKITAFKKVKYIYLPHLKEQILSLISVSVGFAWKSGIAAEVIAIPNGSIGDKLYQAKIYLNSSDLLAWTVTIVLMSVAFEKILCSVVKLMYSKHEGR